LAENSLLTYRLINMQDLQKHKYDYKVDPNADTAPARVVRMVGKNKKVLEVGSGPGSITKQLKETGNCSVTALEIDPDAIELVKPFCEAVYSADLNASDWGNLLNGKKFEVVLAADVLEHVYNPLAVLKTMSSLLEDNGRIILSLPHVGHSSVAACLLLEDFEYRDWGLLDKTHIRFFGLINIQKLVSQAGLSIRKVEFVVRHPRETEFADKWSTLSSSVRKALLTNKYGLVYQVVLEATVSTSVADSLILLDQPVELSNFAENSLEFERSISSKVKRYVGSHLSPEFKIRIRKLSSKLGLRL
jgi:2-polyprenyl-3-methyl-5-hydroxy-6-metoxy-1,4-benzoquinol methylase